MLSVGLMNNVSRYTTTAKNPKFTGVLVTDEKQETNHSYQSFDSYTVYTYYPFYGESAEDIQKIKDSHPESHNHVHNSGPVYDVVTDVSFVLGDRLQLSKQTAKNILDINRGNVNRANFTERELAIIDDGKNVLSSINAKHPNGTIDYIVW